MKTIILVISVVVTGFTVLFQTSIWQSTRTVVPTDNHVRIKPLDVKLESTTKEPEVVDIAFSGGADEGNTKAAKQYPGFPLGVTQTIVLNSDDGTRSRLSGREWRDQVRDWLLLAAVGDSGLSAYDIGNTLFDLPPLRYGYLKASGQFEYGTSRSCYIGDGKILAIVQAGVSKDARDDVIADVIDRHRKDQAGEVSSVELFEYRLSKDNLTAKLTRLASLDVAPYLSLNKGYRTATVTSLKELGRFMRQIDDLTYAEVTPKGLVLGGRKIRSYNYRGIGLQEVAAIWQSEQDIAQLELLINAEETAFNNRWNYRTYRTYSERITLEAERDRDMEQVKQRIKEITGGRRLVSGSGFSLDPTYDFDGLRVFISALLTDAGPSAKDTGRKDADAYLTTIQRIKPQLKSAVDGLVKKDIVPWLKIIDTLETSNNPLDQIYALVLKEASNRFRFQAARYDGKLQGTEAGMVLFYTDLLAKIWAINYLNSAPIKRINGFVDHTRVKLSPIYTQESRDLSSARLWFGPTDRGFQIARNYGQLFFQRISTRVYSKGHNPLDPANEVQTSTFLAAPIDWWDDHYEEVARYEPEYFRLNEIMKWSLLIGFLNEAGNGKLLQFLNKPKVVRNNWFPTWASNNRELKFKLWNQITFYKNGYKGTATEALQHLRGKASAGGVSLAPKTLFRNRSQIAPALNKLNRRSNINYVSTRLGTGEFKTLDGVAVKLQRSGQTKVSIRNTPRPELRLRATDSDLVNVPVERVITKTTNGLKVQADAGGTRLGELNISKTSNGFKIGWQARDIDAGQTLALRASRSKNPEAVFARDPAVEQLIKLPDAETYAVKLQNSDKWMVANRGGGGDSTVGGGWQSRVAKPEKGGSSFQLKWVDKRVVEEQIRQSPWVALRPSSNGRRVIVDIRTRGPPAKDTASVQLITGEKELAATADHATGEVYISTKDLPATTSQRLLDIPQHSNVKQFHKIVATAQDGAHIPLANKPLRIADTLKKGDVRRVAADIIAAPEKANQALNKALENDLITISKLVAQRDTGRAVSLLAKMRQVYGPQAEFKLWEGLAELSRGRPQQAALALGKGTPARIRNPDVFFDEIHSRLANSSIRKQGRDSLKNLSRLAQWQGNSRGKTGVVGNAVPRVYNGSLAFEFHFVDPLRGGRILSKGEAQSVGKSGQPFYRQDSPGLNNLDWNASHNKAFTQAIDQHLGKVVELPRGDIANLNPTKIIVPTDTRHSSAGARYQKAVDTSTRSLSRVSGSGGGGDPEDEDEEEFIRMGTGKPSGDNLYILVEKSWSQ